MKKKFIEIIDNGISMDPSRMKQMKKVSLNVIEELPEAHFYKIDGQLYKPLLKCYEVSEEIMEVYITKEISRNIVPFVDGTEINFVNQTSHFEKWPPAINPILDFKNLPEA